MIKIPPGWSLGLAFLQATLAAFGMAAVASPGILPTLAIITIMAVGSGLGVVCTLVGLPVFGKPAAAESEPKQPPVIPPTVGLLLLGVLGLCACANPLVAAQQSLTSVAQLGTGASDAITSVDVEKDAQAVALAEQGKKDEAHALLAEWRPKRQAARAALRGLQVALLAAEAAVIAEQDKKDGKPPNYGAIVSAVIQAAQKVVKLLQDLGVAVPEAPKSWAPAVPAWRLAWLVRS